MVDDDIIEELKPNFWVRAAQARYNSRYIAHPDCRDPDHPKCADCYEGEDDE